MSALIAPTLQQLLEASEYEDAGGISLDPHESCRFCRCTEDSPCAIPLREEADGNVYLARSEAETTSVIPCGWFVPRVCSAPACIEKLLLECRNRVLLFDAQGRRTG